LSPIYSQLLCSLYYPIPIFVYSRRVEFVLPAGTRRELLVSG
jgi:hypothetical protein